MTNPLIRVQITDIECTRNFSVWRAHEISWLLHVSQLNRHSRGQIIVIEKLMPKLNLNYMKTIIWKTQPGDYKPTKYEDYLRRSIVGSLIYLVTFTRPDFLYLIGAQAHQMYTPTRRHIIHLKDIIRFLQGTNKIGLNFRRSGASLHYHSQPRWTQIEQYVWKLATATTFCSGVCRAITPEQRQQKSNLSSYAWRCCRTRSAPTTTTTSIKLRGSGGCNKQIHHLAAPTTFHLISQRWWLPNH